MKRLVDRLVPALLVLALLLLVTTCGEEPLLAPEKPPDEAAVSVAAVDAAAVRQPADDLVTVSDVLEDPFVRLLIGSLKDRDVAERLRAASLRNLRTAATVGDAVAAHRALASARAEAKRYADREEADVDDTIVLAVLGLVLDGVDAALTSGSEIEQLQDDEPQPRTGRLER